MIRLTCSIVTPEATALVQEADFVAVPLYDGELGIGPLHSPLIGRLGYGELRMRIGNQVRRFYVDGGFVQVLENVVSVLTNRVIPADQIEVDTARKQLAASLKRPANTPELMQIRDREVAQARGQLLVSRRDHSDAKASH
jgi:F-type H+-transporting ATPase subunit epsilon